MNILLLANHLNIGGITSYLLTLATGLKKRGHGVFVASSGGETLERFVREGITFIPIPIRTKSEVSPKVMFSLFKLLPIVKKESIDIVHCNTRVTQVLGSMVSRISRVPYVSTFHGFFKRRFSRLCSPCLGACVIAISEPVKEHLLHDFKVDENKISLIHNGIDTEKFKIQNQKSKAEAKKNLGLHGAPAVGIVARLSSVKGHIYLIRAMREVLRHVSQAQLVIAGEGEEKVELIRLVRDLGIESHVHFIPNIEDTRQVLWALDVFVMPSLEEGLGLGLMEAMASGVAVVGSEVGGIKSLIRDKENGLLVASRDVQGLASAIVGVLKDDTTRERFAKNGQAFIAEYFSQDRMVDATEKVYARCL